MALPLGYVLRHPAPADLLAVQALLDACEAADTGEPRVHQLDVVAESRRPSVDIERDWSVVETAAGELAGFAWLIAFDSGNSMGEPNVHPGHDARGLEEPLLEALEARAGEIARERAGGAPVRLSVWCEDIHAERRALLRARGFAKARDFFLMRIDLREGCAHPELPAGFTVRAFRPGVDERALYEATQEAFAEHFNFEPDTFEDYRAEWAARDVDPDLWLVGWAGDEVVGEVAAVPRGADVYVESVSVRKPWRGRGLALALLLKVFGRLRERGMDDVFLGVDAENATGAVRLYEKAGMRVWRRFELFERRLS